MAFWATTVRLFLPELPGFRCPVPTSSTASRWGWLRSAGSWGRWRGRLTAAGVGLPGTTGASR